MLLFDTQYGVLLKIPNWTILDHSYSSVSGGLYDRIQEHIYKYVYETMLYYKYI